MWRITKRNIPYVMYVIPEKTLLYYDQCEMLIVSAEPVHAYPCMYVYGCKHVSVAICDGNTEVISI